MSAGKRRKRMIGNFGQMIYTRRTRLSMPLAAISKEMGGSPSESFLWRIETGKAEASPSVCVKLARALHMPEGIMLNAAGHATPQQQQAAFEAAADLIGEPMPVVVTFPVVDAERPDVPTRETVRHILRQREEGFVTRLSDPANEPFIGEIVVSTSRQPATGQGVVVLRRDRLSAWTNHGTYLENGEGERLVPGEDQYEVRGCVIRLAQTTDF